MTDELVEVRRKKRIVEYIISGFKRADKAVTFGNTLDAMITGLADKQLCQLSIAAPDTTLAVTENWNGDTVLKVSWRDLKSQHISSLITDLVRSAVDKRNGIYPDKIKIEQEIVREKPQAQFISPAYIPRTSKVNSIG